MSRLDEAAAAQRRALEPTESVWVAASAGTGSMGGTDSISGTDMSGTGSTGGTAAAPVSYSAIG